MCAHACAAGANLVQLYTGFVYRGPALLNRKPPGPPLNPPDLRRCHRRAAAADAVHALRLSELSRHTPRPSPAARRTSTNVRRAARRPCSRWQHSPAARSRRSTRTTASSRRPPWRSSTRNVVSAAPSACRPARPMRSSERRGSCIPSWRSCARAANCASRLVPWTAFRWCRCSSSPAHAALSLPPAAASRERYAGPPRAHRAACRRTRRVARGQEARRAQLLMNAAKRHAIFERFRAANPKPTTELEYSTPFELLVAVILSAQATDKSVNAVTRKLFPVARTPRAIADSRRRRTLEIHPHDRPLEGQGEECHRDGVGDCRRSRGRSAAHARSARSFAGSRTQNCERGPQHDLRRADNSGRHAHLPRRQSDEARAGENAAGRGGCAGQSYSRGIRA